MASFPTKGKSYTKEETDALFEDIDYYTTDEVDELVSGVSGSGLKVKAFGVFWDTNSSNNALNSSDETIGFDDSRDNYNIDWITSSQFGIEDAVDSEVSYIRFNIEFQTYFSAASASYTSVRMCQYSIIYSDDNGSTWSCPLYLRGLIDPQYSTSTHSRGVEVMCPHSDGRRYALRVGCENSGMYLYSDYSYTFEGSTVDIPLVSIPVRMTITAF